jgi:selenocysteine lyase/cysteine desulfurase
MDPDALREDVPVTGEVAYFNTGASGPSTRSAVEAVSEFQAYHEFESPAGEGFYSAGFGAFEEVRETVAAFVGAAPEEVTLTESTTHGINLIASSIDWNPGDTVVRTGVEHPSGRLPWERLEDTHDIETEIVEGDRGRFDHEDFAAAMDDARLVCLSAVSWNYGTRLPVREVAEIGTETDTLVLVDAVQVPGQYPLDVAEWGADFVVGSGHKWLLGPWGTGFLWLSDAARRSLRPTWIGPRGVEDMAAEGYSYTDDAGMFELTTTPVAVYKGLEAAIETIESVGVGTVRNRIERLTDRLKTRVEDDRLLSPRAYESGLVSVDVADPKAAVERLREDGLVVRSIPDPACVRASVHAFNTREEVDRLASALRDTEG